MNKKIKVIDLFNKRARKEQMPYKIEYGGEEYQLEDFMYINTETKRSFGEDFDLELCLLNEVEILEDNTEEIEELDNWFVDERKECREFDIQAINLCFSKHRDKINELVKVVNKIKEGKE